MSEPTLCIDDLRVHFRQGAGGGAAAVRGVSLTVGSGECLGIVGESGSGKTQLFLAVMGLLASGGHADGGVRFEGRDILGVRAAELNRVRGTRLTMMFQDPMTSLTPHLPIGVQLAEILVCHAALSWREAGRRALAMLERVEIPDARRRLGQYPHELSGGMRQRVMLGMALLCGPSLLIADEPTTALDVTVQASIMATLGALRRDAGMSLVLISHDVGLVAQLAGRIVVMYAGRVVESGAAADLLAGPLHPYTVELLKCVPRLSGPRLTRMPTLAGRAPGPNEADAGCAFATRCPRVEQRCRQERPLRREVRGGAAGPRDVACHLVAPA